MVKRDTFFIGFYENPTALTTFEQSPTQQHFFVATLFFQLILRKAHNPIISEHLTFDQYLLNSWSNMHVNFVYWISLHPKKVNLPIFFWDKHHIKEQNPRTNNLNHQKAGSVAVERILRLFSFSALL